MEYGKIFRGDPVTFQRNHNMQDLPTENRAQKATTKRQNPEYH